LFTSILQNKGHQYLHSAATQKKSLLLSHALWRYICLFSEQGTIPCTQQSKFHTKSNSPSHSFNSVLLKHLHHYIFQLVFTTILRQLVEFSESSGSSLQYLH